MALTIASTPAGFGMEPVGLHERAVERHAFEEERIEQRVVFHGELREDRVVVGRVARAEIPRRLHAGEQHRNAARLELRQDGVEVLFHFR